MTTATGIAGAQDYVPPHMRRLTCVVCGDDLKDNAGHSAMIVFGLGVVQACSADCVTKMMALR